MHLDRTCFPARYSFYREMPERSRSLLAVSAGIRPALECRDIPRPLNGITRGS